jgi:hypothetical protein
MPCSARSGRPADGVGRSRPSGNARPGAETGYQKRMRRNRQNFRLRLLFAGHARGEGDGGRLTGSIPERRNRSLSTDCGYGKSRAPDRARIAAKKIAAKKNRARRIGPVKIKSGISRSDMKQSKSSNVFVVVGNSGSGRLPQELSTRGDPMHRNRNLLGRRIATLVPSSRRGVRCPAAARARPASYVPACRRS